MVLAALVLAGCGGDAPVATPTAPTSSTSTEPTETASTSASPVVTVTPAPTTTAPEPAPSDPPTQRPTTQAPTTQAPQTSRYVFPVSPADAADYGQTHHDYPATDVFEPCGSDVVAVTGGVVEEISRVDTWDPATDDPAVRGGLSISLVGDDGVRYYLSHLLDIAQAIQPGTRVGAGEVIAHVGDTGNAAGTGCHVHFGLSPDCGPGDWQVRRGILYPWPYLDEWRGGAQTSPAAAVAEWLASHPADCVSPPA